MTDLRDKIARMVQLFDPEFGTYQELADRILDIPEIAQAFADQEAALRNAAGLDADA